jgi:hypothetical protein
MLFSAGCQGNARNGSCVTTIVGYRGNLVYRVITSIPLWVTCGRFPWEAPTIYFLPEDGRTTETCSSIVVQQN